MKENFKRGMGGTLYCKSRKYNYGYNEKPVCEKDTQCLINEALRKAHLITEEEEKDCMTPQELADSILSEFNKMADRIEEECVQI